ncbi:MAG: glycosyltransferase family 2 protein [Muribaculaceae bacterium]|nr:glycosyltransferase family 2 protein [Muribaculaceae bacterium]
MAVKLAIVVPCYNEMEIIEYSINELFNILKKLVSNNIITNDSYIVCVDDGSKDCTWSILNNTALNTENFISIKLSRNFGQQNAIVAGLTEAIKENFDVVVTIDADLQDDINTIEKMISKFNAGAEIVYGIKNNRKSDSIFKRKSADVFYDIMQKSENSIYPHHSDFRLMSRNAVELLLSYPERNLFLRGIVPLLGFSSEIVYYERKERKAGKSKYPLMKMMSFAIQGITSFSIRPIRMIFSLGLLFLLITLSVLIYVIVSILLGKNIPGWASIMLSLWFIGSLILMGLGVIGEYIGKIYIEVKQRPRFIIEKTTRK